jgi:hypothetical protein
VITAEVSSSFGKSLLLYAKKTPTSCPELLFVKAAAFCQSSMFQAEV